ncbi:MAG TPA: response regulator [Candidatus Sulfotelmatobacter sp.]|jgi:two-component system cell cycle sensor histidine kinase/response regulator CckA|nr:response regulator [Candidatus Sulfotelmatobacter sp.]
MGPVTVETKISIPSAGVVRVLLLEKNPSEAARILRELKHAGMEIAPSVAGNESEFEKALSAGKFDAVISAGKFTDSGGLEALRMLRASGHDIPFVLVTGASEEKAAAECIRHGVDDYVQKNCLSRLPFALSRVLGQQQLREEALRMRASLRESETHSRELTENSIYGTFKAGSDGTFYSGNEALLKILACSSFSEAQALNLANDVFRYPETFAKLLADSRERKVVHIAETEWRRRDGGFVSVRLHLRCIVSPGAPDGLEGIVEDVTEMRALERQLQQAQKFETIGQLAGGIAHDFNNVLGAVLGWAEIGYDQSREHPQIAEYFAHIRQQADRAAALTRELLTFARRQPLQPRPVQLNQIVENLMSFLDKVIGKDIEIKVVAGSLQPVKAEPAQMEQVLMNICLNARDAMPDGGVLKIETEMIVLDDSFCHFYPGVVSGTYVVLSISDTGAGMSPEVRDRIFEPFFTTKERGKGSGMGLATVYGIVRQHGGFVHVYSEPGQGTLFHVYLPVMENALPDLAPGAGAHKTVKNLQGTETILLAEDHDSIRELSRQSLTRLGYQVLAAADGRQALRLAELERPDLAVLDVVMPHMGGAATAAQLLQHMPGLPILFTSGFSENANNAVAQVRGSHYLQKPYGPTSLASTIRDILDS